MKKSILLVCTLLFGGYTWAQSAKYNDAMKNNIANLDSAIKGGKTIDAVAAFVRIGDAEKTQWLPYYYAAYATATDAIMDQNVNNKDAKAAKAEEYLTKAENILGKENSETAVLKAIIATVQMTVDPQSRFMTYGQTIGEALERAKKLDPTNPRPYLVEAQNTFYTPEQFGGGKDAAKPLFEKAATLFAAFVPANELAPVWGKENLDYFMSQYK